MRFGQAVSGDSPVFSVLMDDRVNGLLRVAFFFVFIVFVTPAFGIIRTISQCERAINVCMIKYGKS